MKRVLIWGGTVVDPSQGLECLADVVCEDGNVSRIVMKPSEENRDALKKESDLLIDATGKIVCSNSYELL